MRMRAPSKSFENLIRELKKFDLPPNQFAVFGSGPIAVRGLLQRKINDLDLIVTKALWKKLSSQYPVQPDRKFGNKKIDLNEGIEIWENFIFYKPEEIERMIREADIIGGLRYVKLEEVISFKKFLNRPKDQRDIKAIENYLKKAY